ncbi:hypothetical protein QAD02_019519 [Eretmocerus hayati]|uniref:Uncharacterized protein n=1 Tax=Eretmocerus hayati TaxID=131215 RepID=A0ACC2PN00_9HYME|nr:hypothetical protein QAD02_019519 [Eretmocerus hayati]
MTRVCAWPSVFSNFSKLPRAIGKEICSTPFTIGIYEFRIRVYPGGEFYNLPEANEGYVGIYLETTEPSTPFTVKCAISILDLNGNKIIRGLEVLGKFDVSNNKGTYGFPKYAQHEHLSKNVLAFTNDNLIVLCELIDLDHPGSSHCFQRLSSYEKCLCTKQFSDVDIIVKGKVINAHKVILVSGNKVFASMFEHKTKESEENIIRITDIDFEVMAEIIRFIYTGQVCNINTFVKEILVAADKYGIDELKDQCSQYLCRLLMVDNVLSLISFADLYRMDKLKEMGMKFFVDHKKEVVKIDGYKELMEGMGASLLTELVTYSP